MRKVVLGPVRCRECGVPIVYNGVAWVTAKRKRREVHRHPPSRVGRAAERAAFALGGVTVVEIGVLPSDEVLEAMTTDEDERRIAESLADFRRRRYDEIAAAEAKR